MNAPADLFTLAELSSRPLILALDAHGIPSRWISWQQACFYYARGMIAWVAGDMSLIIRGGHSRITGEQSLITANSIIALRGAAHAASQLHRTPPLNNRELFHRDRHICAYCGNEYGTVRLTRDHVLPLSQGGGDTWMNLVTACRGCNQRKGGRTPERAGMQLLYAPYIPNRAEYLILSNRHILADQMDFLARHSPAQSRVRLAS